MKFFILSLIASSVISWLSSKILLFTGPRAGLVDQPGKRKIHSQVVPLGGLALFVGFAPLFLLSPNRSIPFFAGLTLVTAMGAIDDIRKLSPKMKLAVQFVAGLVVVSFIAIPTTSFTPLVDFQLQGLANKILILLWLIGITNAINLVDGIDGLASGISLIIGGCFVAIAPGETLSWLGALIGALVGFGYFNAPPAKLFLGDGGSYFLGFTLAYLTLVGWPGSYADGMGNWPIFGGILLLLFPIGDVMWAIVRRIKERKGIMQSDEAHIHHLLLQNIGQTPTLLLLLGFQVLTAIVILSLYFLY